MKTNQFTRFAAPGSMWRCAACGKVSKDRYGLEKTDLDSPGWDESCMLNAVLIDSVTGKVIAEDVKR